MSVCPVLSEALVIILKVAICLKVSMFSQNYAGLSRKVEILSVCLMKVPCITCQPAEDDWVCVHDGSVNEYTK